MDGFPKLTHRPEWTALADHRAQGQPHLRELFAADPGRAERYVVRVGDLHIDYSKQLITDETLALLQELAAATGVFALRDAMFRGERINVTEDRAVLHTALRASRDAVIEVDGENVVPKVHAVLDKMADFAERIRSGEWTGHTGKRIRNVVNIGIGGSDLGPAMAYEALRPYTARDLSFRFVSNVDGSDLHEATRDLDPAETLFIVASKTFHHDRDDHQRHLGAVLAAQGLRRRREGGREALRGAVHERGRRSPGSASTRTTCSSSGTGSAAGTRTTPRSACP